MWAAFRFLSTPGRQIDVGHPAVEPHVPNEDVGQFADPEAGPHQDEVQLGTLGA